MRRQIMFTALLALLLMAGPAPTLAADTVQVTLPSFSVTLNGQTNGNEYSRYPLIVYKNITYFPMKVTGSKNAKTQTAKLADGKITVNGKVIDNSQEEYPLLVFRDVTYFPLTWRFAVNEFGWDYRFDQQAGLVIGNDKVKLENREAQWEKKRLGSVTGLGVGYYSIQFSWNTEEPIVVRLDDLQTTQENKLNPGKIEFIEASALRHVQNLSMQYEIYKAIGQEEELVYRKQLPIFPGNSEMECLNKLSTPISYWSQPNLQKGKYILKIGMDLPEVIYYYDEKDHLQSLSAPYPIELANFAKRWPCTVLVQ